MGFIKAQAGPGEVLRPPPNGLPNCVSKLPTRVPAAALELGLCLVIPLLKTLFLICDFCAIMDSGITFCSITTPFSGFSANDGPLSSQTHRVSCVLHSPLTPLLTPLSSASTKCPLWWPSLACPPLSAQSACITPSPPSPVALFRARDAIRFSCSPPHRVFSSSCLCCGTWRLDYRPDVGFLEVSLSDFLALPA